MTKEQEAKLKELIRTTKLYLPVVTKDRDNPYAMSAAKYYPALKKLAAK